MLVQQLSSYREGVADIKSLWDSEEEAIVEKEDANHLLLICMIRCESSGLRINIFCLKRPARISLLKNVMSTALLITS